MRITFISVLIFSIGCSTDEPKDRNIHVHLVPPLRIETDTSSVPLTDLIPSKIKLDSVTTTSPLHLWLKNDKLYLYPEGNGQWIGSIRLNSGDRILDVPIYFSNKKLWEYSFPDKDKKYSRINLVGDMNAWDPTATPLKYKQGQWEASMWLNPGEYGYKVELDGKMQMDPYNNDSIPNGLGDFNSRLYIEEVPRSHVPQIYFMANEDTVFIHSSSSNISSLAFWQNTQIRVMEHEGQQFVIPPPAAFDTERSHLRIFAQNEHSRSNDLLIPLHHGKHIDNTDKIQRSDIHAMRLYFLMVDRFYNGSRENDMPTDDPEIQPIANFFGGDIQGVNQKLKDGYFDSLHMNSIWLSPIPKNPKTAYGLWDKGGIRSKFSAYHGYWPVSFTSIDERFGSKAALKELVESAHQREMNVLLDFVAHHVHELHPVYQARKDEDWATNLYLPDGSLNTEKWDEHRLTTWFDTFLPTLNLEKDTIAEMVSDSALYWLKEYGIDGFRHDATKHVPLNFWRILTAKVREYESSQNKPVFQIGETYGSASLISSYLSYGMLDAQFDFNMYDALVNALTGEKGDFNDLAAQIRESLNYYGHHHMMGNMSGNQDKPRFMSLATEEVSLEENTKLAGWTRNIDKQSPEGFALLAMMHAFNHSLPGIPVIYYGDEIGLPGGNDPDNRRMMRFDTLSRQELALKKQVSKIAELRTDLLPLQWGTTEIIHAEKDLLLMLRTYGDEAVLTVFNKSAELQEISWKLPFARAGYCKSHFNKECKLEGTTLNVLIPGRSFDFISLENIAYE